MLEQGLAMRELASKIGVSHQSISQWLNAQNGPTNRRLAQTANALGVPIERLILPSEPGAGARGTGSLAAGADDTVPIAELEAKEAISELALGTPGPDEKPEKLVVWIMPPLAASDAGSNQSSTVVIRVDDIGLEPDVRSGDYIFTDISYREVVKPGVYLIVVAGLPAWRRCFPLQGQKVLVEDRFVKQEIPVADLVVRGLATRLLTNPIR
jgi:transcriptional regulator with XRE-family HTH domain